MWGQHYQNKCLPFSLGAAPRVFTKVLAVVAASLWCQGIHLYPNLDDWLIRASSRELLLSYLQVVLDTLFRLEFSVNQPKVNAGPHPTSPVHWCGPELVPGSGLPFTPPFHAEDKDSMSGSSAVSGPSGCVGLVVPEASLTYGLLSSGGPSYQAVNAFSTASSIFPVGSIYKILIPGFFWLPQLFGT